MCVNMKRHVKLHVDINILTISLRKCDDFWALLTHPGPITEAIGPVLEPSWGHLGASWGDLGPASECFVRS